MFSRNHLPRAKFLRLFRFGQGIEDVCKEYTEPFFLCSCRAQTSWFIVLASADR
jgi:hypothetical protein